MLFYWNQKHLEHLCYHRPWVCAVHASGSLPLLTPTGFGSSANSNGGHLALLAYGRNQYIFHVPLVSPVKTGEVSCF